MAIISLVWVFSMLSHNFIYRRSPPKCRSLEIIGGLRDLSGRRGPRRSKKKKKNCTSQTADKQHLSSLAGYSRGCHRLLFPYASYHWSFFYICLFLDLSEIYVLRKQPSIVLHRNTIPIPSLTLPSTSSVWFYPRGRIFLTFHIINT